MNLSSFLSTGIKDIAGTVSRFYLGNPRGVAFALDMAASVQKSAKLRDTCEKNGIHVPPFLIASITSTCNLRCPGCYAVANGICGSPAADQDLNVSDWKRIMGEADDLGVSFILLAGGEPLLRQDVIECAAEMKDMIFPVFTNGTLLGNDYLELFDAHRNLIPVLSIEGDATRTDSRRGSGVADGLERVMSDLKARGILFGVSITVTNENVSEVTASGFVTELRNKGCGIVFYVEYVPAEDGTDHLVLSEAELLALKENVNALRNDKQNKGISFLSFPGDEEEMGGCLAAGRGFFHINTHGGAEPCPFSPFSEMSLKNHSLLEVIQSPFFSHIREISAAEALSHKGSCTLFQHKDEVANAVTSSRLK